MGYKHTPEAKKKIGLVAKGRRLSVEHKLKLSVVGKGRKHTVETKMKISAAKKGQKGHPLSNEAKMKLIAANTGRKHTAEAKIKIGAAKKGANNSKWIVDRTEALVRVKLSGFMRRCLCDLVKSGRNKYEQLMGYTKEDLRKRLESQFVLGMNWGNHGDWHIDHIKPISKYLAEKEYNPKIINALSNLQSLWKCDNLIKSSKFQGDVA